MTKGSSIRSGYVHSCGCIHSRNEVKITQMLIDSGVNFKTQYAFKDLKGTNGGALRFDFAIFQNGVLSHLIEYNGLQHYTKTNDRWGEQYETRVENDCRKRLYCENKGIRLTVIPYDMDYSIDDLL